MNIGPRYSFRRFFISRFKEWIKESLNIWKSLVEINWIVFTLYKLYVPVKTYKCYVYHLFAWIKSESHRLIEHHKAKQNWKSRVFCDYDRQVTKHDFCTLKKELETKSALCTHHTNYARKPCFKQITTQFIEKFCFSNRINTFTLIVKVKRRLLSCNHQNAVHHKLL